MKYLDIKKSHQRKISDKKAEEECGDMFGKYWEDVDIDLSKTDVRRINYITAQKIIEEHEWIGTMPLPKSCRYMYGIYFRSLDGGEEFLGGVEVFVEPSTRQFNKEYPRQALQLNRGACLFWTPPNTATYFLSRCLNDLKKEGIKIIIAYCTQEAGEIGNIYQALSWDFVGFTQASKSYWLDEHWVSERTLADKKKWARNQNNDAWVEKFENLKTRVIKPKLKYVKILVRHSEERKIRELYQFHPLPYPKKAKRSLS